MTELSYGFGTIIADGDFGEVEGRVVEALQTESFGVLTEIDVQTTLKKKLDLDFRRYTILGACNPQLAHRALVHEMHIGLLLPCNVVLQETADGGVAVSIASPRAMFALVDNSGARSIADEAEVRLRRVLTALGSTTG